MLNEQIREFCKNTYGHGFGYITMKTKNMLPFERLFWATFTCGFLIGAIVFCIFTLIISLESITITVVDTPNHPISNFPFPAITICNFNTISKSRAEKAVKNIKFTNTTFEELVEKMHLLHYLTDSTPPPNMYADFLNLQEILESNNVSVENLLRSLAPTCKEMLERCLWKGHHVSCESLFQKVKTPNGFCCAFNYLAYKSIERTNVRKVKKLISPRRVSATGYFSALELVINSVPKDYVASEFSSYGLMIIVHFAYNFLEGASQTLLQYVDGLTLISMKPFLYRTDDNVKHLSIDKRKCLFIGERQLEYFVYTYNNCVTECKANIILELCGCIPFFYLNLDGKGSMRAPRTCNLRDVFCLQENKESITQILQEKLNNAPNCTCLEDCVYCKYTIEGSTGIFTKEFVHQKPSLYGGVKLSNQSVIRIYFDDVTSTRYTTSIKYYWHTILGLIGGVLGLWIGFSAISIIEIVYFLIIRPIIDLLLQRRIINLYQQYRYR